MTTARMAVRLLASQAVKGVTDARPTIAEGRVYDSRMSDIQPDTFDDDAKATVIVFTDSDEGEALSQQNGGPPFHRNIDLVFDIGMMVRENSDTDGTAYVIGYPNTDARLEASIDLLETQIWRYLSASIDPLPLLFQRFVRVWKHESHRHVEEDSSVKMARRVVTFTCEINDDDYTVAKATDTPATGLNLLPEPLRTVALALPAGCAALQICTTIAQSLAPYTAPVFEGADFTIDPNGDKAAEHVVVGSSDGPQPD